MSLCTNVQSAELSNAHYFGNSSFVEAGSKSTEELSVKLEQSGASIVAVNNQSYEISSLNDKKDIFISGSLDKACAQGKLIQQISTAKYNQTYNSTSHNISSYLKNEICTRAP